MTLQNLATVFGPTLLRPAENKTGKLSMDDLLSAGARDAMTQIGVLRYLLDLKLRGTFGVRLQRQSRMYELMYKITIQICYFTDESVLVFK